MNKVKVINGIKAVGVTIISGVSGLALTNLIEKEMTSWGMFKPQEVIEEEIEITTDLNGEEVEELI